MRGDACPAQAFAIAEELVLRVAPYAVVIVSTRELRRGQTEPSLLDVLTAGTAELDLDDPAAQDLSQAGMRAYIAGRLAGVDRAMDPDAVAGHLAGETPMISGRPFLLARLRRPGDHVQARLARAPRPPPGRPRRFAP